MRSCENIMKVGELGCAFNMPPALHSRVVNGEEVPQGLPPYGEVKPYVVDEYPACPSNWMHGSGKAASYFVPVKEDWGMWLDFNSCTDHTHDVAVVLSIQGINPVTGQKQTKLVLEKYGDECPLHKVGFETDRFCPKCGFKWPAQNYLATTGTPHRSFWLDGFRSADGKVRQYLITAEKLKGVASQLIGEDRVFAIGIAFFLSKQPKPVMEDRSVYRGMSSHCVSVQCAAASLSSDDSSELMYGASIASCEPDTSSLGHVVTKRGAVSEIINEVKDNGDSPKISCSVPAAKSLEKESKTSFGIKLPDVVTEKQWKSLDAPHGMVKEVKTKKLEIGAGASINQRVHDDPKPLDYWETEPVGVLYVNYCTEEEAQEIISQGKRDEKKDGFLTGLKTGN